VTRSANDHFGRSVSIDGDTAAGTARPSSFDFVSATRPCNTYLRGMARLGPKQQKLTASESSRGLPFLVIPWALNGVTAVVTASRNNAAYVYVWNGASWVQQTKLTASDGAECWLRG
jgi:hypothetical protein